MGTCLPCFSLSQEEQNTSSAFGGTPRLAEVSPSSEPQPRMSENGRLQCNGRLHFRTCFHCNVQLQRRFPLQQCPDLASCERTLVAETPINGATLR